MREGKGRRCKTIKVRSRNANVVSAIVFEKEAVKDDT